jgi:hypothetical protein
MTKPNTCCAVGQITCIFPKPRNLSTRRKKPRALGNSRTIFKKQFAPSGKSPVYFHHRKNFGARARETGRGLFQSEIVNRTAAAGASTPHAALVAMRRSALPSELALLA